VGSGGTDSPLGDTEMGSVQGAGIQTRGWFAYLEEVSQDLENLRGVGDHSDDFHGFVTTRAGQGIRLVDFLDQAGPCGAALLDRHRELGLRLVGRTDAERWLGWVVALPALGSEAEEVRAAGPSAASPRGVQPVGAEESAARVGQVLEDLDQKLDGGEDLRVGVEIVGVGSAIDYGIRAPLVDEQFLQRDRGAHDVLGERFASLGGAGWNAGRCVHAEATVSPLDHVLGQPLIQQVALEEKRDDSVAEAGAHLAQIDSRDMDESALWVKASLQEQAVPMGVPSSESS